MIYHFLKYQIPALLYPLHLIIALPHFLPIEEVIAKTAFHTILTKTGITKIFDYIGQGGILNFGNP